MLLFETERKVEERDVEDSGELEKEDNSVCVLLMMTLEISLLLRRQSLSSLNKLKETFNVLAWVT